MENKKRYWFYTYYTKAECKFDNFISTKHPILLVDKIDTCGCDLVFYEEITNEMDDPEFAEFILGKINGFSDETLNFRFGNNDE